LSGAAALLGLTLGLAVAIAPAAADKVGVAAAVNPDAFSSLAGSPQSQLSIGKSIFYNERINTTGSGLVQVLLVDGSTFTVGPGSDLVIDKFVYDPKKGVGQISASFSKGVMRFVGGKISKNEGGVSVDTPAGALAIRGGIVYADFKSAKTFSILFVFGEYAKLGSQPPVYEPGNGYFSSNGQTIIKPFTAADLKTIMASLTNSNFNAGSGGVGSNTGSPNSFQPNTIENAANEITSDANMTMVQTSIQEQLVNLTKLQQNQNQPQEQIPPPEPVKEGGTFTGYASGFLQSETDGSGQPQVLTNGTSSVVLDPEGNTVTASINADHIKLVEGQEFLPVQWLKQRVPLLNSIPSGYIPSISLNSETRTITKFNLGFLGNGSDAYIDDNTFLALGDDGTTSFVRDISKSGIVKVGQFRFLWLTLGPYEISYPVSHQTQAFENVGHEGNFASIPDAPLCQKCAFLKYGFWASDVTYDVKVDKMNGWWVASSERVIDSDDLPTTGEASYSGTAIGTLATSNGETWTQGTGAGEMSMTWDFALHEGELNISHFGNQMQGYKSFGGTMSAPGVVEFGGSIAGDGGLGAARGSFISANGLAPPSGVMGSFGIAGSDWKANGIFGGGFTPNQIAAGH
jgi:hypothetical protein